METPTIIGLTAGTLTTLSLLPQVIKAWKSKSTKDISLGTYCAFTIGLSLWVVYGIELNSPPIIITNVVTLILAVMILLLKIKHG
ncbi:conserved hypothetical protein [Candidatus Sulfobium mesophilum]|uniref:MtN3 and saliva related transmembrane protein n=1 Tax=Candidatus Sulfobium mesophilum TaxID=2016548 RepID=A0A2U3QHW5_9BACT|nr:conserved hypothetical protein [Candidatus Sulfobium mesophilum]